MVNMQATATQNQRRASTNPEPDLPQRPFQCSTCKRSFTRADHLTRHVRAHTKAKPYVCPICSKGFARIDLLKRHVTNHDSESANKRQKREIGRDARVVQACEACSQSHLRCEDEKPCNRCKKRNIPCQVPDASVAYESELNEMDAVHAAQDLLDLSNGFDFPTPQPVSHDAGNRSLATKFNPPGYPANFGHPSLTATGNGTMQLHASSDIGTRERIVNTSNSVPDVGNLTVNQQYTEDAGTALAFFDNTVEPFEETPSIDPFLPEHFRNMPPFDSFLSGVATPRGILDFSFNLDIGLTDLDLSLLDQYNFEIPFTVDTPSTDTQGLEQPVPESDGVLVRTEAFKQSIWRYLPQRHIHHSGAEQANLAFSDSEKDRHRRAPVVQRRAITERLHRVSRDRLMALVLATCSAENIRKISSAFPSIELLDTLIQFFLTSPSLDAQSWFHLPTFSPSNISPELLAVIVSAGAVSTPDVPLRKLGFALYEASRIGQARAFEADNTAIRDLKHLQNLFLELQIGMWSGISRKMEIAESFLQALMTMLRRGSRFRNSTWRYISPSDDHSTSLEDQWKEWVHQESYLRLVYRTFELDRQSSMALLKPPLISYSEMQLPLPSPNIVWQAKTAVAWKMAYLSSAQGQAKRPSAIETFLNLEYLGQYESASLTYLHMIWGMVWEFRQMSAVTFRSNSKANDGLILSSRYQDLTKQLEDFRVNSPPLSKGSEITLELMLLHLNAPLDEIQLFAGIEGQEEARSAYPALREWSTSVAARQALWHAGQILRAAEGLPKTLLCNFNAVAVYHAGLILWGYGFLKESGSNNLASTDNSQAIILNGEDSLSARRFITMNRGNPSIQRSGSQVSTQINDVSGVMDSLIYLLQASHEAVEGSCPPLVGNLVQLLEGLQSATR
ncbi:C6 transcription factor-like protein RegA [Phaeosphaeriaceae sp. PMI808]|nr:C6 transcription factor-like protein RegA [Phaeosphaeriaceae sp. PMI808]